MAQDITTYLNQSGEATITATEADAGSTDDVVVVSRAISPSTFACTATGTNTATLTVADAAGNTGQASFTVTVLDTLSPQAASNNLTVYLAGPNSTVTVDATALDAGSTDNCGIASYQITEPAALP